MLALTEDAAQAIGSILEQSDEGSGLRISAPPSENGAAPEQLQMSVAPAPAPADQVIESDGGPVFVDEAATPFLDDKVLDASVTADATVQFELLIQSA